MSGKEGTQSSTFCMLPSMHIYGSAGGTQPCCEAQEILKQPVNAMEETWNNSNYRELRRALLNGEKPLLQRLLAQRAKRNSEQQAPVAKRQLEYLKTHGMMTIVKAQSPHG